jgi:anti-anti-sigma regulatory factor
MKNQTFTLKISKKDKNTQILSLEGDLSRINAVAIKTVMLESQSSADSITLQIKNVEKLDITTIQIIRAMTSFLNRKGKQVEVISDLKPDSEKLLINSGFSKTF